MTTEINYSASAKILHNLSLNYPSATKLSNDIDQMLYNLGEKKVGNVLKPVFVTSLAQSGTTIITKIISEAGDFAYSTYNDMPFALMPIIWSKITKRNINNLKPTKRVHGDGIEIDNNSIEAFEEVFWRVFDGNNYIKKDRLTLYTPDEESLIKFKEFVIRKCFDKDKTRYLAKNNNNILRVKYIKNIFPDSIIICPLRDPMQHCLSLYDQHVKLCKMHKADKFSLNYMNWLGHFEFGSNCKYFNFSNKNPYEPENFNYWLYQWIEVYEYLYDNNKDILNFVSFENLCSSPVEILTKLLELCEINSFKSKAEEFAKVIYQPEKINIDRSLHDIDKELEDKVYEIYNKILTAT